MSRVLIVFCFTFVLSVCEVFSVTLYDLGDSYAYGVSADGSVVVGFTSTGTSTPSIYQGGPSRAFSWTPTGGMQILGTLAGGSYSSARAVSGDGTVVVGRSDASSAPYGNAFRWTQASGLMSLGTFGTAYSSGATGVSRDGSVVVGEAAVSAGYSAFRWTQAGGMQGLGRLPGGSIYSGANGVSGDGFTVVGYSDSSNGGRAFRWTESAGMQDLGVLTGGVISVALGANNDGSSVVGWNELSSGANHAFLWTQNSGMQDLGMLEGAQSSLAYAINGDGSIVVGSSGNRAFLWNSTSGMFDLNVYVSSFGVDLTGWTLGEATAISSDGSTIVGNGTYNGVNRAFTVSGIPEPSSLSLLLIGVAGITSRRLLKRKD